MTAAARKEQLQQYINMADDSKINAIVDYIESMLEPACKPYNKWQDTAFVAEMDRRIRALESGSDKGYTWEEVKERARTARGSNK